MQRRARREGGQNQQQPLLLLLLCFSVSFCQLSFSGVVVVACTENGEGKSEGKRKNFSERGLSIKTHMYSSRKHTNASRARTQTHVYPHTWTHTHLFMSVLMVQSAPEHANDFHYANACKSDPTI